MELGSTLDRGQNQLNTIRGSGGGSHGDRGGGSRGGRRGGSRGGRGGNYDVRIDAYSKKCIDFIVSDEEEGEKEWSTQCQSGPPEVVIDDILRQQNEQGYWTFEQIGLHSLLELNTNACLDILKNAGLQSLGKSTTTEIQQLLATIVTLLVIFMQHYNLCKLSYDLQRLKLFLDKLENDAKAMTQHDQTRSLGRAILQATLYSRSIHSKHPLVCSNLELGSDWMQVATTILDS